MRCLFLLICLALASFVLAEQYTDRYDKLNIDEVVANRRLLTSYLKCVLDKGRCTPEGKLLKENVKDALQTACSKCTQMQKRKVRIAVNHVREHEKEYWEEIKKKYDPNNEYKEMYEAFLNAND